MVLCDLKLHVINDDDDDAFVMSHAVYHCHHLYTVGQKNYTLFIFAINLSNQPIFL